MRLFDMVLVVQFCTKESDSLQVRHTVSRLLCQNVDIEQCHFERLGLSEDAKLALVGEKLIFYRNDAIKSSFRFMFLPFTHPQIQFVVRRIIFAWIRL